MSSRRLSSPCLRLVPGKQNRVRPSISPENARETMPNFASRGRGGFPSRGNAPPRGGALVRGRGLGRSRSDAPGRYKPWEPRPSATERNTEVDRVDVLFGYEKLDKTSSAVQVHEGWMTNMRPIVIEDDETDTQRAAVRGKTNPFSTAPSHPLPTIIC